MNGKRFGHALSRVGSLKLIRIAESGAYVGIEQWGAFLEALSNHKNLKEVRISLESGNQVADYLSTQSKSLPFNVRVVDGAEL